MRDKDMLRRDAGVSVSEDDGNMVLSFSFSSEEPYLRYDDNDEPWIEILGHDDGEVDLSRLQGGAPVFINHGDSLTSDHPMRTVGTTTRAWLEGGKGRVEVKMSRRDSLKPVLQDIRDGILPNVSVGYKIMEKERTGVDDNDTDIYRVTNWMPFEVTLADVPADATVGIGRSINFGDGDMGKKNLVDDVLLREDDIDEEEKELDEEEKELNEEE